MRKIKLGTEKYYHVFNRGAGQQEIFCDGNDFMKFITKIWEFNNKSTYGQRDYILRKMQKDKKESKEDNKKNKEPGFRYLKPGSLFFSLFDFLSTLPKLVDIVCYNLIYNHYHFILKQLVDDGVKIFMHKLGTGYANYFNAKYKRKGVLFERPFEAFPINKDEKLWWLSAYVNCNYEIHQLGKAEDWQWSSYQDYSGIRKGKLCNKEVVLSQFSGIEEYKQYCQEVIKQAQDIKKVKKYLVNI